MNGWGSKVGKGQAVTASRKWLVKAALSVHNVIKLPYFPNILHTLDGTYRKATRRKDDTEAEGGGELSGKQHFRFRRTQIQREKHREVAVGRRARVSSGEWVTR